MSGSAHGRNAPPGSWAAEEKIPIALPTLSALGVQSASQYFKIHAPARIARVELGTHAGGAGADDYIEILAKGPNESAYSQIVVASATISGVNSAVTELTMANPSIRYAKGTTFKVRGMGASTGFVHPTVFLCVEPLG